MHAKTARAQAETYYQSTVYETNVVDSGEYVPASNGENFSTMTENTSTERDSLNTLHSIEYTLYQLNWLHLTAALLCPCVYGLVYGAHDWPWSLQSFIVLWRLLWKRQVGEETNLKPTKAPRSS